MIAKKIGIAFITLTYSRSTNTATRTNLQRCRHEIVMVPPSGGHREADAGQGTLPLGEVLIVDYLMESSNRVPEQSEIERVQLSTRLPPGPCIFMHVRSTETFPLLRSTSNDLIHVGRICLFFHTGTCTPS